MSIINEVILEAESMASLLEPGDRTDHYMCPVCSGGDSGEKTFVVWKNSEEFGWVCYRNSCGTYGRKPLSGHVVFSRKKEKQRGTMRPFDGLITFLTKQQEHFLYKKIGFKKIHQAISRVGFCPDSKRFAFPINDPLGERRGVMLRSYDPAAHAKAVNRMDNDEPSMSWYIRHGYNNEPLFIVEDIPSAVRLSVYVNSVALCGTGLYPSYLEEILQVTDSVVFLLDNDASEKAIAYAKTNKLLFENSAVHLLAKDIKNMTEPEVADITTRVLARLNKKNNISENEYGSESGKPRSSKL